jgi:hypothetical protein
MFRNVAPVMKSAPWRDKDRVVTLANNEKPDRIPRRSKAVIDKP